MSSIVSYFQEVRAELSKVVWPKREQVVRLTFVIFAVSGLFGAFIGLLDFTFVKLLEFTVSR